MTMQFTGERMMPGECSGSIFWEHIYRYRFAVRYSRDKDVLDVACGEGYGAYALNCAGAATIVGVDISEEACLHAQQKYGIDARLGDACALPITSHTKDTVVSFETIEHVNAPERFLSEAKRVLRPDGTLVVSSPNGPVYSQSTPENAFHVSEMTRDEFVMMLQSHFVQVKVYAQRVDNPPLLSLCSLSAQNSPWRNVRGFWRLRQFVTRKALTLNLAKGYAGDDRETLAKLIDSKESWISQVLNPYLVRPESRNTRRLATYVVAVCRSPK